MINLDPPDNEAVLDPSVLDGYRDLEDETNPDLIQELVTTFLTDLAERHKAIVDAIERGDGPALRSTAHALKGSSATMGAKALAVFCKRLEAIGSEGSMEEATEVTVTFESLVQRTEQLFRQRYRSA